MNTLFPSNPTHDTIYELSNGSYFKYDSITKSWNRISSNSLMLPVVTPSANGSMSSVDYKKLNRLLTSPPLSTIIGNDCIAPFKSGNISLTSGDNFIGVNGNVPIKNVTSRGELISKDVPFSIHQNTYGFDFTLDLPALIDELKSRNQFNVVGKRGAKGKPGPIGDTGPSSILSGPPGDAGIDGLAPPCGLSVSPDSLQAEPHFGMNKALVRARIVKDDIDKLKFKLVFDRQTVGPVGYAADKFNVRNVQSPWVLAIASGISDTNTDSNTITECNFQQIGTNIPSTVYYLDIEPIIEVIRQEFIKEVGILKKGYEDIVKYWVQTMSDLFDQQKAAICCALQFCMSKTKSTSVRQHMENVAAAASGTANILLHARNSDESVKISSTKLTSDNVCNNGNEFPQYPDSALEPAPAKVQQPNIDQPSEVAKQIIDFVPIDVNIDPFINNTSMTGVKIPLQNGVYTVTVLKTTAQVDGSHRANIKIIHVKNGFKKTIQILDKGSFNSLKDAAVAYEGLSLSFSHDGGFVTLWLPSELSKMASGYVTVTISKSDTLPPQDLVESVDVQVEPESESVVEPDLNSEMDCNMSISHLSWYERGWVAGKCCGFVVNLMGMDYIIFKRSVGSDDSCGGGESLSTPCLAKFIDKYGHPSFAWPTFDGVNFAPLPNKDYVNFKFSQSLNDAVADLLKSGSVLNSKGNPSGLRHLIHQLSFVLFPSN